MPCTLAELVQAILDISPDEPQVTSMADARQGLISGRFMLFDEGVGKSLEEATTMLWDALQAARGPLVPPADPGPSVWERLRAPEV